VLNDILPNSAYKQCSIYSLQGYGLTETVGGISLSDSDDLSVGCVGRPLPDVRIKLQNWEEGGYTVNDEQGARSLKLEWSPVRVFTLGGSCLSCKYYTKKESK
jgi:hypothetical protein